MKFTTILAVMLAASLSFGAVSYDGMDYTAGTSALGANGGSGWTTAWSDGLPTLASNDVVIVSPGLTYTDGSAKVLITGGNTEQTQPVTPGTPGHCVIERTMDTSYGPDSGEVYASFLVKHVAETGTLDYRFRLGGEDVDMVVRGWRTTWEISGGVSAMPTPTVGETQFMVAKVTFASGDDTIEVWQNPDLVTPGAADYSTTKAVAAVSLVQCWQQNASGHHGETNQFDEIRVGGTWAEVTPYVPEPAFGIIALLGAFALRLRK